MSFFSYIISLFESKKCYSCQQDWHFFCRECCQWWEKYEPYCYVCKRKSKDFKIHKECQSSLPYLEKIIVLTHYRNLVIKKWLRCAKYYKKFWFYSDIISWNQKFFERYLPHENCIFVPVPMHFLRKWKRGYNQSEIIAQNLSKICQIPVEKNFLRKNKYTLQQSKLSKWKRENNLSGSFALRRKAFLDTKMHVILVDDVVSSGSTLLECARILSENGYKNISAVCIASD